MKVQKLIRQFCSLKNNSDLLIPKKNLSGRISIILFILIFNAAGVLAFSGNDLIDHSFDARIQTTQMRNKRVSQIFPLSNGKMLVTGIFNTYNGQPVGALIKLNPDGSLDTEFNYNFILPTNTPPRIVGLQFDGKFIISGVFSRMDGTTHPEPTILRLNPDGTIDSSFRTPKLPDSFSVKMDSNKRLIVAGTIRILINGQPILRHIFRLDRDGNIDPSFDYPYHIGMFSLQNDKVVFHRKDRFPPFKDEIIRLNEDGTIDETFKATPVEDAFFLRQIDVQSDNKIIIQILSKIIRFGENGGIDTSFQTIVLPNIEKLSFQSDGRFTVSNKPKLSQHYSIFRRFLADGTLDPSFTPYIYTGLIWNHSVTPDGSVIIGDYSSSSFPGISQTGFIRLLPSGERDLLFNPGGNGFQFVLPGKIQIIKASPDDKVLIVGRFDKINQVSKSHIARLNADSSLDTTFQIKTNGPGNYFIQISEIFDLELQADGKILLTGSFAYFLNDQVKRNIVRLNPDGTIDPAFETIYLTSIGNNRNKITLTADNKVLIGTGRTSNRTDPIIPLQLLSDGARDTSFNPTSFSKWPFIKEIAVQPDGKILIAGASFTFSVFEPTRMIGFIVRLNEDGSFDTTFRAANFDDKEIFSFELLPNGRILVVSHDKSFPSLRQSLVYRLNSDGSTDTSFESGLGSDGQINAIATLPDGSIILGGNFTRYNGQPRQNVAFLAPNGELDPRSIAVDSEILSITVDSQGRIIFGGGFTIINEHGQNFTRSHIARLNFLVQNKRSKTSKEQK